MITRKDFDDCGEEFEHLDLDNSSASDDGETSADAEANLKMMMLLVIDGVEKPMCKGG